MDTLLIQKISYALIIFSISMFSGLFPLLNMQKRFALSKQSKDKLVHKDFVVGEALASGIFLGAALLHMLSDAAREFIELKYHYPFAFLLAGVVFLGLLLLEHIGREMKEHNCDQKNCNNSILFVFLAVVMLSVHALLEGVALGTREDFSLLFIMFVAIIAHKWAASYSLAVQISKNSFNKKLNWVLFLIFALMTPIGIFFGNFISTGLNNNILTPVFTSMAAGTFLYIGTLHGLNRAVMVERCCNLHDYFFVILGFSIMAVVGIWV